MTTLVCDSGIALRMAAGSLSIDDMGIERLIAPPLLWSEVNSALHEARWRGELDDEQAAHIRTMFKRLPIERRAPGRLHTLAWEIADELGWAKTYDAEFLALARLHACRVLTADRRLLRGAARLGLVVGPAEL